MRRKLLILALVLAAALPLKAQFVLTGDDPGHLRWYSINTQYYKIIYPEGADSLARNYGTLLEQFRPAIGLSLGFTPGEGQLKMPVVLHTHNPYANGSVAWAPKRMDFYTLPQAYGSDPEPWDIQLAAHEPRHQAQLELDRHGFWRWASYVVGQIWDPAIFQLYLARCLAEGDAVTVETGLTTGPRTRTADFLNYYRVSLDAGQYRNWYRWRYGSYKYYTPDLYKLGYITVAGSRALYHDPLIMANALEKSRRNPLILTTLNLRKVVQDRSGLNFKEAFPQILDYFKDTWDADTLSRAPFCNMEQITPEESFPVSFRGLANLDGRVYLIRSGYLRTAELGYMDGEQFHAIRPFASHTSALYPDAMKGRLYWSETISDARWELSGKSVIRYYSPASGKVRDLTHEGRLYNPHPSKDGRRLAAVEYPVNGGSAVVVVDSGSGKILLRHIAPDGIQACAAAWIGETLYVSGVSNGGYGVYSIGADGAWNTELAPSIQKLVNFGSNGERLSWVSDLSGVNELYSYNPSTGELSQITSTRYGATDFCEAGGAIYGVSQTLGGKKLFRLSAVQPRPADFSKVHSYPIEDRIVKQERSFRKEIPDSVALSAPKRYSKLGHLMRFHSWAPIFFDYDEAMSLSMDYLFGIAAPGVTGYFQNTLGTMSGMVGFAFRPDMADSRVWRPSLHAKLRYSGLYPVIEASVDFGDQMSSLYARVAATETTNNITEYLIASGTRNKLLVSGQIRAYIPLSFSKGGLLYGFVPQINYGISNNRFDNALRYATVTTDAETGETSVEWQAGHVPSYVPMQRLGVSARGYFMMPRAQSQVYPRWGIGFEAGFNIRPGMAKTFRPNWFAYAYGYTPGFSRTQGLKLTGTIQRQIRLSGDPLQVGELAINTLPRGFSSAAGVQAGRKFFTQAKVTADYAIPVFVGDLSLQPIAYIRKFLVVPHGDFTLLSGMKNLWSAGADITADFSKLIIPFNGSIGVSFSYLGGSAFDAVGQSKRWYVGLIMSYDLN